MVNNQKKQPSYPTPLASAPQAETEQSHRGFAGIGSARTAALDLFKPSKKKSDTPVDSSPTEKPADQQERPTEDTAKKEEKKKEKKGAEEKK